SSCINSQCGFPPGCEQIVITWTTFETDSVIAVPSVFPIKVIDSIGNELILNDTIGIAACNPVVLVWPGDANDDLIANIFDIFPIAIHYGASEYARDSISNLWIGHNCQPWNISIYNGSNLAHADCNGDGDINWDDFNAIILNYGLTHVRSQGTNSRSGEPVLALIPDKSIYIPGETVTIEIQTGDATNPVNELYGVALMLS